MIFLKSAQCFEGLFSIQQNHHEPAQANFNAIGQIFTVVCKWLNTEEIIQPFGLTAE